MPELNRGWTLIAVGNPIYYKMAWNLAMSMRLALPETKKEGTEYPITLLTDGQQNRIYKGDQAAIFDQIITFKPEDIEIIQKQPFYSKLLLDQYSPYEHTIYLDADTLCIGPVDHLFDLLSDYPFCAHLNKLWPKDEAEANEANGDRPVEWCSIGDIYNHVGNGGSTRFSDINSSLVSFRANAGEMGRNNNLGNAIFQSARKYFTDNPPPVRLYGKAGHFPDELAFECAMLELGYENPHFKGHIHFITKSMGMGYVSWIQAGQEKPLLSLFGPKATTPDGVWNLYRKLIPNFTRKLEVQQGIRPGTYQDGFKNVSPADKAGAGHDRKHFQKEYKRV